MVMLWIKMWTKSRGRLPTYLLVGRSGPNVVHACNFFFSFGMITRYAYLEDDKSWLMFLEDQGFLGFSSCFQKTKGSGSWLMFLEDQGFFGLWLMFSEDQRFWILAHVFRGLGFLDLGSCFQRTKGFLGFGSCFQRTKGSGS